MNIYMKIAIEEAGKGIGLNEGGPFGAVIVKKDTIISQAHNRVLASHDPTAHAEILAIREAGRSLNTLNLSECTLYTTCEPCPMCLAAVIWARISSVYYGCTRQDAARIGFRDEHMYGTAGDAFSQLPFDMKQIDRDECIQMFKEWEEKPDKVIY